MCPEKIDYSDAENHVDAGDIEDNEEESVVEKEDYLGPSEDPKQYDNNDRNDSEETALKRK